MTVDDETIERIKEYAINADWEIAFGGKSRRNRHLFRVNKILKHLAHIKKARMDVCIVGGWLHDIGLIKGNEGHCFTGSTIARDYLKEIGVSKDDIDKIVHCIEAHDGEILAGSVEARVVHDADTIDKMGPLGFVRHVWKISLIKVISPRQLLEFTANHIWERESRLYFIESRRIVKPFNSVLSEFISNTVEAEGVTKSVMEEASRGIPSEEVAYHILKNTSVGQEFRRIIRSQMLVDYL